MDLPASAPWDDLPADVRGLIINFVVRQSPHALGRLLQVSRATRELVHEYVQTVDLTKIRHFPCATLACYRHLHELAVPQSFRAADMALVAQLPHLTVFHIDNCQSDPETCHSRDTGAGGGPVGWWAGRSRWAPAGGLQPQCMITDETMLHLGPLRQLNHLTLTNVCITGSGLAYLADLPALTRLSISRCPLDEVAMDHLSALTALTDLRLVFTQPYSPFTLGHLRSLTALTRLDLTTFMHVDIAGVQHLRALTALTDLSLSYCVIDQPGLDQLGLLTNLVRLNVFTMGDLVPLFDRRINLPLWRNPLALTALAITGRPLSKNSVYAICGLSSLQQLVLRSCGLTARHLARLSALTNLTVLCLSNMTLTRTALMVIYSLRRLTHLELVGARICHSFEFDQPILPALTHLDLSHAWLDPDVLTWLPALSPGLTTLVLTHCTTIRGEALAQLALFPRLVRLNLADTEITTRDLECIGQFPALVFLNIGYCGRLDQAGVQWFRDRLPGCQIVYGYGQS